jgi:hypothetical protein
VSEPENREPVERKPDGKFLGSGNPGGRPRGYAEFRAKCREHTDAAIARLVEALADERLCVQAAQTLLAYGWGKPSSAPEDNEALRDAVTHVPPELVRRALTRLAGDDDE